MQNDQEIGEITEILSKWSEAKEESLDEVFPRVYGQLKQQARKARRNIGRINTDETLSTTSLVHEMYFKLRKNPNLTFESRGQFYALCRVSMQRLLHDYYFRKSAKKHEVALIEGSDESRSAIENLIDLSAVREFSNSLSSLELSIAFDEALTQLEKDHPKKVEIIILKYWLDETDQEIADHLNMSKSSVRRELAKAMPLIQDIIGADDFTHTTVKNINIEEMVGDDKNFLKQLTTMLKEQKKPT